MVFVDFPEGHIDPRKFVRDLGEAGVEINPPKGLRIRFVTHYQVGDAEIARACDIIRRVYDASVRGDCVPRAVSA